MARRGGAQQLQTEVKTDEELEKFLTRSGLLILEVYSEWCGPCLGMVGILRRVKLEVGGDNLHLALCRVDNITALKRFYKKSEPTWLFVTNGRAVNIAYGSDAPKLVALIVKELEKHLQNTSRPTYDISELQPVEAEAFKVKIEAIDKAERADREKQHKKRIDYLNHCTDLIMENLPDIGVTVFGPQVSRDMFKKLSEPADQLKMQCKDRKYLEVSTADFEVVNYSCKNPLSTDVVEQLDSKELLICFWKIDESVGPITQVLAAYAHELTKERVAPPDEEINVSHPIPPIISPMKVKFEVEVEEGEVWVEEISSEEEARLKAAEKKAAERAKSITRLQDDSRGKDQEVPEDDVEEEASEEEELVQVAQPAYPGMAFDLDLGLDDNVPGEEEIEEEEEEPQKTLTRTKRIKIPPIWVANNRRTHAALIYVFFRSQTTGFLPPDPPPEPPHIIMTFEANKRDDIMEVVETNKEDIPQYGFFTNDTPGEAKLIANSVFKYDELQKSTETDRFVLKVNKVQSYTMLSLVQFEPTYCSNDVKVGKADALKFFPEDYKTEEETPPHVPKQFRKKKKVHEETDVKSREASTVLEKVETATGEGEWVEIPSTSKSPEGEVQAGDSHSGEEQPGDVQPVDATVTADSIPPEEVPPAIEEPVVQEPNKEESITEQQKQIVVSTATETQIEPAAE